MVTQSSEWQWSGMYVSYLWEFVCVWCFSVRSAPSNPLNTYFILPTKYFQLNGTKFCNKLDNSCFKSLAGQMQRSYILDDLGICLSSFGGIFVMAFLLSGTSLLMLLVVQCIITGMLHVSHHVNDHVRLMI